jgi:RNA polymerase sigma-70 factor (ECF subfamily)
VTGKPEELSDEELVELAKKGDREAFGRLYDRHVAGLGRALASFAGPDRDTLDDLIQDVFYRVIDRIRSYSGSHPFSHWLFTVALNVGRNFVRRRTKVLLLEPDDFNGYSDPASRARDLSEELLGHHLFRQVSRLPVQQQEVVSLRIGAGLTYGEIGRLLDIPEGTARSRMHQALETLRAGLGVTRTRRKEHE